MTHTDAHALSMDRMYRYQRHIYDLTRKYYLLGRDGTIRRLAPPAGGTVLEVGCGTGRNLLLAARAFPQARLFGLDISAQMLATARRNFSGRVSTPELHVADACAFRAGDFGETGFDRVLISYALSMIPDWPAAIDCALAALKPGGSLHVVDFGQQEGLPGWFGAGLKAWLRRFHVTPRADLNAVLAERARRWNGRLEIESIGGGYAWRAIIRLPAAYGPCN